jgi:hypothetical protein
MCHQSRTRGAERALVCGVSNHDPIISDAFHEDLQSPTTAASVRDQKLLTEIRSSQIGRLGDHRDADTFRSRCFRSGIARNRLSSRNGRLRYVPT